jgi:prepilin-type N-terminal cleavage/methylation domain-containing protein/prepilin-type processing-associated H-X9-DG protein
MTFRHGRKGFTLIELLVVIAIIAILAAILFPVFAQARDKARSAACLSNVKQLALGVHMYAQDYDEVVPAAFSEWSIPVYESPVGTMTNYPSYWYVVIQPYVKNTAITKCPSDGDRAAVSSYAYNYPHMSYRLLYPTSLFSLAAYEAPAETLVFAESQAGPGQGAWTLNYLYCPIHWAPGTLAGRGDANGMAFRHQGGGNIGFLDGHAKFLRKEKVMFSDNNPNSTSQSSQDLRRLWGHPPYGPAG